MIKVTHEFKVAASASKFILTSAKLVKATGGKKEDADEDDGLGGEEDEDDGLGDDDAAGDDEVTMDMIQEKVSKLVKAGKKPKIQALMEKHKVKGITKIPDAKLEAFYKGLMAIK